MACMMSRAALARSRRWITSRSIWRAGRSMPCWVKMARARARSCRSCSACTQPDSGSVIMDGAPVRLASPQVAFRHGIGMVHQEFMLVDTLTVAQNVILGLKDEGLFPNMRRVRARVRELATAHGLEVDPDSMVGDLSIGMRQRVEILKLLYRSCRLLILDEPTAVLTGAETAHLLRLLVQLRAQGCTVLLVTHKLAEILEVADRITVIRKGRIIQTVQKGNLVAADLARMMIGREGGPAAPPARQGAMPAGKACCRCGAGVSMPKARPSGWTSTGARSWALRGRMATGRRNLRNTSRALPRDGRCQGRSIWPVRS
ncbi:ATP-binding cassette domain-containing protein [Komagataeibacter rhaeticus]|nr:ATP-binding cassette domain-containing protein [Komagataeibacter rhaeticus]